MCIDNKCPIPERMLVISPTFAATIGLEEAIVYQALVNGSNRFDEDWVTQHKDTLRSWLVFFNDHDIKRLLKSLSDQGIVHFNTPPFGQSDQVIYSFSEKVPATSKKSTTQQAFQTSNRVNKNTIPSNWLPSQATTEYIASTIGVPPHVSNGCIQDFVSHHSSKGTLASSWSNMFIRWVNANKHKDKAVHSGSVFDTVSGKQSIMTPDWKPDSTALEILTNADVDLRFTEDCVNEFKLFWIEKGEAADSWNTKFVSWVRRQWARYSANLANPTNPLPIPSDWEPDRNVFEILEMAGIDNHFAESLVSEFVLYWKESNKLHSSWGSKFLQHVKHHWSKRLTSGGDVEQREHIKNTTLKERLADDSWAK